MNKQQRYRMIWIACVAVPCLILFGRTIAAGIKSIIDYGIHP
jgi:hypothetical protein